MAEASRDDRYYASVKAIAHHLNEDLMIILNSINDENLAQDALAATLRSVGGADMLLRSAAARQAL